MGLILRFFVRKEKNKITV